MPVAHVRTTWPTGSPSERYRLRERFVDDHRAGRILVIECRERAAARHRRAHRLEVAFADAVHLRLRQILLAARPRLAFDQERIAPADREAAGSSIRRRR